VSCFTLRPPACIHNCSFFVIWSSPQLQEESAYRELVTPLEARRQKYLKRRHEHGDRSEDVSTANSGIYSAGTP
jgi:hypothetical protein